MTKKDYQLIAESINESRRAAHKIFFSPYHETMVNEIVRGLAKALKLNNPRFDADRFYNACMKELKND